ncbi:MAG: HlyD family type I secretion periplasmic adaptor subunit, partial [Desulfosalsimonas sp.]|uniref:HlyD family type I secretion periplasmic adaptor subunit n=1 Tax=Desulfosalsimonas sp. TaxID=3073848 RepID=UPI003970E286
MIGRLKPAKNKKDVLSSRDIHEFLPAALEVEKTPASPVGRLILYAIVLLFIIAMLWAFFGKIDIVAIAGGKVLPSERVKVIQPVEAARISAIHVRDGQRVTAGDPLVTLDTTITKADVRSLTRQWLDARARVLRLEQLENWLREESAPTPVIKTDNSSLSQRVARQNVLLQQEVAEYQANLDSIQKEYARLQAQWNTAEAEINRVRSILNVLDERVNALDVLQQKKMGPRMDFLELKQTQIEIRETISIEKSRQQELEAAMQTNRTNQNALRHEYYKDVLTKLEEAETRESTLREEKIKAEQRNRQYNLCAPLDGTVEQLAVHTVGGVVTPAQELMLVVPESSEMEVEAMILNKDIGFVQEGQSAEVKVNTFNFTKYGVVDAELADISDDAIQDENLGLIYKARLKLLEKGLTV